MIAVDVTEAPALPAPALPKLTGSPRQVAWATDIRREVLAALEIARQEIARQEQEQIIDRLGPWLRSQGAAVWWIDNECYLRRRSALRPCDRLPYLVRLRDRLCAAPAAPAAPAPTPPAVTVTQRLAELIVTSPYDADYVVGVKALGARWDAASRTWAVPLKERDHLRDLLLTTYRTDGGLPAPAAPEPKGPTAPTEPTVPSVGAIDHLLAELRAGQVDS